METLDTYLPKTLVALVYDYALRSLWDEEAVIYRCIIFEPEDWRSVIDRCYKYECRVGNFYRLIVYSDFINVFDFDDINEVDAYIRKRFHIVSQLDLLFSVKK